MNVLCKRSATAALLFLLLFGVMAGAHAQDDIAAQILARLNQARAQNGLPAFTRVAQLDAAAQGHVEDMVTHGVSLGHRGSDGSTIAQRIANAGYAFSSMSENWAAYRTLDQIMNFWLTDPPHRRNILDPNFRDIGIGIATRASGGWIVVTDFGEPGNAPESAPVVKPAGVPKKVRATPTRAKAAALKPTRTPTRKPTAKPTRAKPIAKQVAPTPAPTLVAMVTKKADAPTQRLRLSGRAARVRLRGNAAFSISARESNGDPLRMASGAALMLAGTLLLGVAMIGYNRSRSIFR